MKRNKHRPETAAVHGAADLRKEERSGRHADLSDLDL